MKSNAIKMPKLSGNQKSMRTHVRRNSISGTSNGRIRGKTSIGKNSSNQYYTRAQTRKGSIGSKEEIRNGSLDLAPKVRKNKKKVNNLPGMFNFEQMDNDFNELEKITTFLKKSLKSKNIKEYIKSNQEIFDDFIDRVDSGTWMGIDLRSMHGFFIKCFKNKVIIYNMTTLEIYYLYNLNLVF